MEYLNELFPWPYQWRKTLKVARRWSVSLTLGLVASVVSALPVESAERVQFFAAGPLEVTLYVEDLEQFAETGEITERFAVYANRLSPEQQESLRSLLNWRFDVDPVMISQFTYSPVGERLLQRAGQIIQTNSFQNGFSALRAAVILAAADEEGCTGINILKQFPLETVQLDYFLTTQVLEANQDLFNRRELVVDNLQRYADTNSPQVANPVDLAAMDQSGSQGWQRQTLSFQNPDRAESSVADIYLPEGNADPASIPVIVISHGLASDRQTLAYIAEHLASHGYGVVVLEHVETSAEKFVRFLRGLEGAPEPTELTSRPRDITAVLDTLTQRAQTQPELQSLNLQAVGVLGQSLGGYTVLAAAGATINRPLLEEACSAPLTERLSLNASMLIQCRITELPADASLAVEDERVKAVFAMNPLTSHIFGEAGLQTLEAPVMLVAGTNDFLTPALLEQIQPFSWLEADHSSLVIVENGTHFSFLGEGSAGVLPVPDSFVGPDPTQSHPAIKALSLAFFNQHLRQQSDGLTDPALANLAMSDDDPFQFTLVNQFPPSFLQAIQSP